jgi:hypothetical protein
VPTRCSSHRRRVPAPIRSAEDALTTLAAATDAGRDPCVVIGCLDSDHRPLTLVVVDDAEPHHVVMTADTFIGALRDLGESLVAAVFVASSGRAASPTVGEAEVATFTELDRRFAEAGVVLLDWFVLDHAAATSVAHQAGREVAW